jgi:tetratricopeptide (TPR) repeat protein
MSVTKYKSLVCLAVLYGSQLALAESPTDKVYTLRQAAIASQTKSDADQMLNRAEDVLKNSRRSMGRLDRDFLQNDITQTRGLVCLSFWQRDRSNSHLRDEGQRLLLMALNRYALLAQRCQDEVDAMEQKSNASPISQNTSYQTTVGNISRANYKTAWTEYLLGLSTDRSDERQRRLTNGLDGFMSFTARGYRNDPIVADCFVGHARCLYELGRYFDVTEILDRETITQTNTTPSNFKRITKLRIKAYEALARHLMVDDSARIYVDSLPNDHRFDDVELTIAVSWARSLGFLISDPVFDQYTTTYEQHLATLCQRISPYGEPWRIKLTQSLSDCGMESPFEYSERIFSQADSVKLESHLLAGHTDSADRLIDRVLDTESSDPQAVTALINSANQLEQARVEMGQPEKEVNRIDRMLVRIYLSLLDRIGIAEDPAISSQEPIVRLTLAKCYLRLQRHNEAIEHYRGYLRDMPTEKAYEAIRGLALAYELIGQYDSALGQWRKLYTGIKRRTNPWIEATYHIICCHITAGDRDHASKVLAHFRVLCPSSERGEWGPNFEAIEKDLLKTDSSIIPPL